MDIRQGQQLSFHSAFSFQSRCDLSSIDHQQDKQQQFGIKQQSKNTTNIKTSLNTTKMSIIQQNQDNDSESCIYDIEDIMRDISPQPKPFIKKERLNMALSNDKSTIAQNNWLSPSQMKCVIQLGTSSHHTVCEINQSELAFENRDFVFRLARITKMKIMFENYHRVIYITYDELSKNPIRTETKFKISLENDSQDDLYLFASKIIVQKLLILDYQIDLNQKDSKQVDRFVMTGEIFKKSQFVGRWDARKVTITDRIQSFKEEVCTFEISNIKEIWTRFQVNKNCLVLKIRHGMQKTELALPIVNYSARFCQNNWLYRIYKLISSN